MPVPKTLRRFSARYWKKVSRETGVSGHPRITSSHVNMEMGQRNPRRPISAREAKTIFGKTQAEKWRTAETAAETENSLVRRRYPLIFINLKAGSKRVFVERPKEQYLAHELGHAANHLACRKNRVITSPVVNEFIAYYYELDYARQHNKKFFNDLIQGKLDAKMKESQEKGGIRNSNVEGILLAIDLFKTVKTKKERLEIVRMSIGKSWEKFSAEDVRKAIQRAGKNNNRSKTVPEKEKRKA